jgi:peroxin-1
LLRPGRLDKSLFCNFPDQDERKDVSFFFFWATIPILRNAERMAMHQILQSIARKVEVSPHANWDQVAAGTEGFSGADLQALIYNAHLEAVHASIDASSDGRESSTDEEPPIPYIWIGGSPAKVTSRAEEDALQQQVGMLLLCR